MVIYRLVKTDKSIKKVLALLLNAMRYELRLMFEEGEKDRVNKVLQAVDDSESALDLLSKRDRYVLRALTQNRSGAARRVIHADAADIAGSPFDSPDNNGTERSEVGEILYSLRDMGLAEREKATWYPTDDAIIDSVELEAET